MKRSVYLEHLKEAHPETRGPWCCDICGMTFQFKSSLTNHLGKHLEHPQYACSECPRTFTIYETFANHLTQHKKKEIFRGAFLCTHCGRQFNTRRGQINHEKTRHSETPQFACNFPGCDVVVTNPQKLAVHKQYHRNEEYYCQFENCGKVFKSLSEFNRHKFHHNRPYKCDECGKGEFGLNSF